VNVSEPLFDVSLCVNLARWDVVGGVEGLAVVKRQAPVGDFLSAG
jgi:hypothetical protein